MTATRTSNEAGAGLDRFNALPLAEVKSLLGSCLAVPRWVDQMAAGRPYPSVRTALERARASAADLSGAELQSALARHPRIGERARAGHDAGASRREQAGVDVDDASVSAALARGNREYEARFGQIFLIRAAGRSSQEILAELRRRLDNPPETETAEVRAELAEIAVLRLGLLIDGERGDRTAAS